MKKEPHRKRRYMPHTKPKFTPAVGSEFYLPLHQLDLGKAEKRYSRETLRKAGGTLMALKRSLSPVQVRKANGKYMVVAGGEFVAAAKELGWSSINCVRVNVSRRQELLIRQIEALDTAHSREGKRAVARNLVRLLRLASYDEESIAASIVGESVQTIRRWAAAAGTRARSVVKPKLRESSDHSGPAVPDSGDTFDGEGGFTEASGDSATASTPPSRPGATNPREEGTRDTSSVSADELRSTDTIVDAENELQGAEDGHSPASHSSVHQVVECSPTGGDTGASVADVGRPQGRLRKIIAWALGWIGSVLVSRNGEGGGSVETSRWRRIFGRLWKSSK